MGCYDLYWCRCWRLVFSLSTTAFDATDNPQEAAAWSAMTQSAGYVIGATGPLVLGWIHDATNSFSTAIVELIVINVKMMVVQFVATTIKRKQQLGEINPNHGAKLMDAQKIK